MHPYLTIKNWCNEFVISWMRNPDGYISHKNDSLDIESHWPQAHCVLCQVKGRHSRTRLNLAGFSFFGTWSLGSLLWMIRRCKKRKDCFLCQVKGWHNGSLLNFAGIYVIVTWSLGGFLPAMRRPMKRKARVTSAQGPWPAGPELSWKGQPLFEGGRQQGGSSRKWTRPNSNTTMQKSRQI